MVFSVAENIWGRDDRPFPTPLPSESIHILGVSVTPLEISVAVGVFAVMGLIELFKRKTLLGKAFEAVSADRDAAELMGVSATRTVMLSYALSGGVAAMAGILVSPITTVGPTMGSALVLKAFSVAVVAGLDSGFGVVAGGSLPGRPGKSDEFLYWQRLAGSARVDPAHSCPCRAAHRGVRQRARPEGLIPGYLENALIFMVCRWRGSHENCVQDGRSP